MHSIAEILDTLREALDERRSLPARLDRKVREKGGMTAIKLFRRKRNDKRNRRRRLRRLLGRPRDKDEKDFVPNGEENGDDEDNEGKKKKKKRRRKNKNGGRY